MFKILRRFNRVNLVQQFNYLSTENKIGDSDYFKNIVSKLNEPVNSLEDLSLNKNDIETYSKNSKLKEESAHFARKILKNPNRFIENRRPNTGTFIQKKTVDIQDLQSFEQNKIVKSEPRNWSNEIKKIKEEKRQKRIYFKSHHEKKNQYNPNENEKNFSKFSKKYDKQIEMIQRRKSFKEKFINFNDSNEQKTTELVEIKENEHGEVIQLNDFKDMMPFRPVVYNLSYFVNDSILLQKFIDMGVMIRKWDQDRSICEFILKLDLERDVQPHLIFLHDIKIPSEKHAKIIQNNPFYFKESLDDLSVRYEYLKSKKFTDESIVEIICKAPRWLSLSIEQVDTKLGWFQNEFGLSGPELREIVTTRPKLITLPLKIASDVRFCLKEFLSFSDESIKRLIKTYPKIFTKDYKIIEANYSYLTRVMKLTNQQIESYPPILQTPLLMIRTRYAFLKHLNRVQFDPTLSNFISIKNMIEPNEAKFVEKYVKSTIEEYGKFLKSI